MSDGRGDASAVRSAAHPALPPSAWVRRWSHLVAPGASVLDVACGSGRHLRWFAGCGCRVTGIDRDAAALAGSGGFAECIVADIESGAWPVAGRHFDAVVVTNYLWRARMPDIVESVAPGGLLVCETFARGQETIGKPSNPDFLLAPGELLTLIHDPSAPLRVIAFEDGVEGGSASGGGHGSDDGPDCGDGGLRPAPVRFVQRIIAVREEAGSSLARRYPLNASGG